MPELPEVETVVREIEPKISGCGIRKASFSVPRQLLPQSPDQLSRILKNQTIQSVSRRGKHILISLTRGTLLVHLRMTGRLYVRSEKLAAHPHERAWLHLNRNEEVLCFRDPRTLGTIHFYPAEASIPQLEELGWEPLEDHVTPAMLKEKLARRSIAIKPTLLDQSIWAGIGNIYASEILWTAHIHPAKSANKLSADQIKKLIKAVPYVLHRALAKGGTTLKDFMSPEGNSGDYRKELCVYDRAEEPCLRCGGEIKRIVQAQRSTYFCPRCQKKSDIK